MDTDRQVFEEEASGPVRGLYADIKATFRAPIVNWFWRTLAANDPAFTRYLWGQVKPLFGTRAFGRYSVAYRDAVLSAVADAPEQVPTYRATDLGLRPPELRELQGQVATFDVVGPRLALLFAVCDRASHGEWPDGGPGVRADTAPLPDWLDTDRGRPPTMLDAGDVPEELDDTVAAVQSFHGLGEDLPSIHRCLALWPDYFARAWTDLEPVFESEAFETAVSDAGAVVDEHLERLPYEPQLSPAALSRAGLDEGTIEAVQDLFAAFNRGPVETVLPTLSVYASTLDVAGERTLG